ncbi:uncharacterized protein LOC111260682 isoform X1 [Varroa jacobsoni]|uniref:uncharacterized protein LOC111260682 isoform X1 n=2 Tax=Varroa jacobsoni TaxID=62625 RepID=UPI000BF7B8EE|nr:uncharacterized protein LOC111260682 isoform X1 [Varroa jacobsoni]
MDPLSLVNYESEAQRPAAATIWTTRLQGPMIRVFGACSSVPPWRKLFLTALLIVFLLLIADVRNTILIEEEKLPEKNLLLTLIFFTPTVRIPYLISRNYTHLRADSLILPSLRDHFYDIYYKRKLSDQAANKTIALGAFLAAAHSKRCARALFLTPRVINLRATTTLLYRGYYGLEDAPGTLWTRQNIHMMPEDRVARWTLRNRMAEQNEANLYTISCDGRNVATYIRYLNRKAKQDGLFKEELENGSSILDLLLFQYFSEGKDLPQWVNYHSVVICYCAIISELVKGFELELSRVFLQDVATRLQRVQRNDSLSHNVIMYVTDYEELMALNKYLQLLLGNWLMPHMACMIKVFQGGHVVLQRAYVPDSRWGLDRVHLIQISPPYNNVTEMLQTIDRALASS